MALASTSLAVAVAHAVTFLARSHALATLLDQPTQAALQAALEANLAAAFLPSWTPAAPSQGSGRRVLAFAPESLPPRPVYKACAAAGVDSRIFAQREFDLIVDPGLVSVRVPASWGQPAATSVVWSAQTVQQVQVQQQPIQRPQAPRMPQPVRGHRSQSSSVSSIASFSAESVGSGFDVQLEAPQPKTLAQRLMEHDTADEDMLFSDLAAASSAANWKAQMTPSDADAFAFHHAANASSSAASYLSAAAAAAAATGAQPSVNCSGGPFAARAAIGHSRSSSRSSVSSGQLSLLSDDSLSTCASLSSVSSSLSSLSLASSAASGSSGSSGTAGSTTGKRTRRVYVDTTKKEVTQYDGGKTNVLTGGVMLGAAPQRKQRAFPRF